MFLLVSAHPGSPGQKAVKQLCMCQNSLESMCDNFQKPHAVRGIINSFLY